MVKKLIMAGFLIVGSANAGMFDSVAGAIGGVQALQAYPLLMLKE